jgi:hypothetical protein
MTAGVLICCRCQQSIRGDERAQSHHHDRPSGPPFTNYSHRDGCPPPTPAPRAVRRR